MLGNLDRMCKVTLLVSSGLLAKNKLAKLGDIITTSIGGVAFSLRSQI